MSDIMNLVKRKQGMVRQDVREKWTEWEKDMTHGVALKISECRIQKHKAQRPCAETCVVRTWFWTLVYPTFPHFLHPRFAQAPAREAAKDGGRVGATQHGFSSGHSLASPVEVFVELPVRLSEEGVPRPILHSLGSPRAGWFFALGGGGPEVPTKNPLGLRKGRLGKEPGRRTGPPSSRDKRSSTAQPLPPPCPAMRTHLLSAPPPSGAWKQ